MTSLKNSLALFLIFSILLIFPLVSALNIPPSIGNITPIMKNLTPVKLNITPIMKNLTPVKLNISPDVRNITPVNFSQEDFITGSFITGNIIDTNEASAGKNLKSKKLEKANKNLKITEENKKYATEDIKVLEGLEGETCRSWGGSYSYAELCYSDIFSSPEGGGNYVDFRCQEGDLYINPIPIFNVPGAKCYDEYGQLGLCLCNNNGCSGTKVSGTYRYYFPNKVKTTAALCYDKHDLGDDGFEWSYISKVYSTGSKILLEPDYYDLVPSPEEGQEPEQINYSQVFPPEFNCTIKLGNYNNQYFFLQDPTRSLGLNFKFLRYGSTSEELYTENIQCTGECTVYLPEDAAKKILPSDWISCRVDYAENNDFCCSAYRDIPSFDLFLSNFKIFNVIPFETSTNIGIVPTLIQGKPFIARIFLSFSSDVITYMDKPVNITLKLNNGNFEITKPYIIGKKYETKDFHSNSLLAELSSGASSPEKINELTSELEKIKKGNESLNILSSEISGAPANEKIEDRKIIIDSENKILEINEDNNEDFGYVQTNSASRRIHFRVYDVLAKDKDGKNFISDERIVQGNNNIVKSVSFIEKIFPLPDDKIGYSKPLRFDFNFNYKFSEFQALNPSPWEETSYSEAEIAKQNAEAEKKISYVRNQIVRELSQKSQDRRIENDIVVGLVDKKLLGHISPGGLRLTYALGMAFPSSNVVLLSYDASPSVLAHEVGHVAGLYSNGDELYDTYSPFGDIADDGWCLESSGKSCIFGGPKINIWTEKNYQNTYSEKRDVPEIYSTPDYSISNLDFGQRYFDMMGTAGEVEGVDKSNIWIQFDKTYKKLYEAYTIYNN